MFTIKDAGWGMFAGILDVDLEKNREHQTALDWRENELVMDFFKEC